ncbi:MAG: hypothetical protein WCC60_22880 [Ilumatobacteraceae bacterium]
MRRSWWCVALVTGLFAIGGCSEDAASPPATGAAAANDAARIIAALKAPNSTCAVMRLYATASIIGGLAGGGSNAVTDDLFLSFSPALATLTADAVSSPAEGAPESITSSMARLDGVFSGAVADLRAAGLTDEQHDALTDAAVEIATIGAAPTATDESLAAVLRQVDLDVSAAASTAVGDDEDPEADAWVQSTCPELTDGAAGNEAALSTDACSLIPSEALAAVFPGGTPVGNETDPGVCEYQSEEIGGPKVTIAALTPDQVRSSLELQRTTGSLPVTEVADLGDEAFLIVGVRIYTSADGSVGGGGTGGATLGIVQGETGLWITTNDEAAIEDLGRAAVEALI